MIDLMMLVDSFDGIKKSSALEHPNTYLFDFTLINTLKNSPLNSTG